MTRRWRWLTWMTMSIVATPLLACKLPVFRYALERWTVDRYRITALVVEGDEERTRAAVKQLREIDPGAGA